MLNERRASSLLCLALISLLKAGCGGLPEPVDDCGRAQAIFQSCGVTLAVLDDVCAGPARAIAQCVLESAESCDGLALLDYDECLSEPARAGGGAE